MGAARDRQELGQALQDAEQDGLEPAHRCPDPERHGPTGARSLRMASDSTHPRSLRFAGMKQRRLGTTGLTVSRLALGTMTWGRDTDEHEARDQLDGVLRGGRHAGRHR